MKTSNRTAVIELIDKFIDELLEEQEVSSSELDPTRFKYNRRTKEKTRISPLTPSTFANFRRKSDKMARIHREL